MGGDVAEGVCKREAGVASEWESTAGWAGRRVGGLEAAHFAAGREGGGHEGGRRKEVAERRHADWFGEARMPDLGLPEPRRAQP